MVSAKATRPNSRRAGGPQTKRGFSLRSANQLIHGSAVPSGQNTDTHACELLGPAPAGLSLAQTRSGPPLGEGGPLEDCRAVREGLGCPNTSESRFANGVAFVASTLAGRATGGHCGPARFDRPDQKSHNSQRTAWTKWERRSTPFASQCCRGSSYISFGEATRHPPIPRRRTRLRLLVPAGRWLSAGAVYGPARFDADASDGR